MVAINIFEHYEHILNTAVRIAQQHQSQLTVTTVVNYTYDIAPIALEYQMSLETDAKNKLEKIMSECQYPHIKCITLTGSPHQKIIEYANASQTDLLIVGSHGRHGLNLLLGSTSNNILHHAPCDVLTVRVSEEMPDAASQYHKIVFATDLGSDAEKLLTSAQYFQSIDQGQIDVIHVCEDPTITVSAYGILPEVYENIEKNAKQMLSEFHAKHNLTGKQICSMGDPSNEINEYANNNEAQLIVLGSHHRSAIGRFFLGSTANAVLHHANQDVLVIKLS